MDNNGPLFKPKNVGSYLSSPSLLEKIEQQRIFREFHISTPKLKDIQIPIEIEATTCCVQFYNLKLNHKIKIKEILIKIVCLGKESHLLCQIFSKYLYGKLGWGFMGRNDLCFNVKIEENRLGVVKSNKREEGPKIEDLKEIFLVQKFQWTTSKMINPKGMDELFWGKDLEDMFDQAKILQMAAKIREYDEEKLFNITKFNLRGEVKDQYKRLNPTPLDWQTLRVLMLAKYGIYDGKELRIKMDFVKQEPRQHVQIYYDRLE